METFRIEVGRAHNVKPTNIVGAIANETGLESRCIGRIEIFDEHSTVDMLAGMPPKVFETLKQVKIGGRRLNISRLADGSGPDDWPVADTVKAACPRPDIRVAEPEARPVGQEVRGPCPGATARGQEAQGQVEAEVRRPKVHGQTIRAQTAATDALTGGYIYSVASSSSGPLCSDRTL